MCYPKKVNKTHKHLAACKAHDKAPFDLRSCSCTVPYRALLEIGTHMACASLAV